MKSFAILFLIIFSSTQAFFPQVGKLSRSSNQVYSLMPKADKEIVLAEVGRKVSHLAAFVTFLSTISPVMANTDGKVKKVKVKETENGIKYIDVKIGEGPYPSPGDFLTINYIGFLSNGTIFDSTEAKKKPVSFRYGKNQIIPGIEEVLATMQPGGERTCTIPPKYAYGSKGVCIEGQGCLVPPDETLKYVIKLKTVGPAYL